MNNYLNESSEMKCLKNNKEIEMNIENDINQRRKALLKALVSFINFSNYL